MGMVCSLEYFQGFQSAQESSFYLFLLRLTSCVWRTFGRGGGVVVKNNVCLLSLNIMIEKIFVFLWFWIIFLIVTSILNFLYYVLMIFSDNDNVRYEVPLFLKPGKISSSSILILLI